MTRPVARTPITTARVSLVCIVLAYLARLPAMAEPLGIDQGIFAAVAQGLARGLTLYREVWDQKPPGIHWSYLIGFKIFGENASAVFWLDFCASVAICLVIVRLGGMLAGSRAGWLAGAFYAVGTVPAYGLKYGGFLERAVPESFVPLFISLAFLVLLRPSRSRLGAAVLAGLFVGIAALFKPTMLIYAVLLVSWEAWSQSWRQRGLTLAAFVAGLGVPIAGMAVWLAAHGAVSDAWIAVVAYNRSYVAIGWDWLQYPILLAKDGIWLRVRSEPLWAWGGLALTVDLFTWMLTREKGASALRVLWCVCAFIAIAANGARLFNTYFLPVSVPLALAAGAFVEHQLARWPARRVALISAVIVTGLLNARYGHLSRFWDVTRADLAQLLPGHDAASQTAYLDRFGGYNTGRGFSARANAELAEYVRRHTAASDQIYIVGMAPGVYFAADRRAANRFVWSSPITFKLFQHPDFTLERLVSDLEARRPELLILEKNTRDSSQNLNGDDVLALPIFARLLSGYAAETRVEDFLVYRRLR